MKHLKLYEEYIPFLINKKEKEILEFILHKLEEVYNGNQEYIAEIWPNRIHYFKIDNPNILLEIKSSFGGPSLNNLNVKLNFRANPPEIDPLVEEEWDEDVLVELDLPFSYKIHFMIKKLVKKKFKKERNTDLDNVLQKIR